MLLACRPKNYGRVTPKTDNSSTVRNGEECYFYINEETKADKGHIFDL